MKYDRMVEISLSNSTAIQNTFFIYFLFVSLLRNTFPGYKVYENCMMPVVGVIMELKGQ